MSSLNTLSPWSNLSICKIGVGPSSSHTLGPLIAGNRFCTLVESKLDSIERVRITLYGSLSLTGRGHLSDRAILWGLENLQAKSLSKELQAATIARAYESHALNLCGRKLIGFEPERDIVFSDEFLPLHENALKIEAFGAGANAKSANDESTQDSAAESKARESKTPESTLIESAIYYSIGGGFVKSQQELQDERSGSVVADELGEGLFGIDSATTALYLCDEHGWSLSQLSLEYEKQFAPESAIRDYCLEIWQTMQEVYAQGTHPSDPYLPGDLRLKRRANGLYERLQITSDPLGIIDFISLYAIAIAEENASGARVVTAPTNGACAVIPAVMLYLKNHTIGFNDEKAVEFLLTAMLIGALIKKNASISGAEAGCQAEIGSASSMAAAAFATALGADAKKACNAAEMAMEHHLGLTCDPVMGLVQIPCIERNAFGAIKAISAARMAMTRKSTPKVSLDEVIATMYQTGKDMNAKYRETSLGGLATLSSVC